MPTPIETLTGETFRKMKETGVKAFAVCWIGDDNIGHYHWNTNVDGMALSGCVAGLHHDMLRHALDYKENK